MLAFRRACAWMVVGLMAVSGIVLGGYNILLSKPPEVQCRWFEKAGVGDRLCAPGLQIKNVLAGKRAALVAGQIK